MKLWYQSLARQTESTPYGEILRKVIKSACDPGTTVHMQGVSESAGIGIHYRFLEYHDSREVIYNAVKAEKEGYDAFLIGNISDACIREAREMVNIPVLGLSKQLAHGVHHGANFALVTISESGLRGCSNVHRYGLSGGWSSRPECPARSEKAMVDNKHREFIVAEFTAAAKRLQAKGAEVIIPAGGDIIVFLADSGIYEIERSPIVNGIVELIKMGEMAVKLRALTGRFTSKRLGYSTPTGDFLERVRKFYGPDVYPGAK